MIRGEVAIIIVGTGLLAYWILKKSNERVPKQNISAEPFQQKVYSGFHKDDLEALGHNKKGHVYIDAKDHQMYFAPYGKNGVDYSRRVSYDTFKYVKKHPEDYNKLIPKTKIYHPKTKIYHNLGGHLYKTGYNRYGFSRKNKQGEWVIAPYTSSKRDKVDWSKAESVDKFEREKYHQEAKAHLGHKEQVF